MQQSQPAQPRNIKSKTYVPTQCTLCMEDMIENLSVTSCGHVFHSMCISQGLEYRGQCPNCRERTSQRQLRGLNYHIGVNRIEDESRIQFLESLKKADQDNYLKLIAKNEEMYTELEVKNRKVVNLQEEVKSKEDLLTSQGEMIRRLNNDKQDWKVERQGLMLQKDAQMMENEKSLREIEKLQKEIKQMERTIREFEKDAQDFERMKKIQASANDNEDEYLKSVKERGSTQEQAKTFYEFLRIKKADLKKSKDELQRVSGELAHYKEKARSLELALQKKQSTPVASTIPNKQLVRKETVEPSRSAIVSNGEKIERLVKQKSQNELQMEKQITKENIKDFYDMASLEEDVMNSSIKGSDEKKKPQKKETPEQSSDAELRVFRNLVYPKGITQPGSQLSHLSQLGAENKTLGIFSNRLSVNHSNSTVRTNLENLKRKSTETAFNMKKVKLSDDFAVKNVQQKLSSFGSFN